MVRGTATRTDTDGHGQTRTVGEVRKQRSGRHRGGALGREGGRGGAGNSRLERAEVRGQGEPNSRNSLCARRAQLQNSRVGFTWNLKPGTLWRGQNAEVRGQEKPEQPNSLLTQGARTKRKRRKRFFWGRGAQAGAVGVKRSLKHTGARPVDGARRGQRSGNSHTDGHGRARTGTDRHGRWKVKRVQGSGFREGTKGAAMGREGGGSYFSSRLARNSTRERMRSW